MIMKVTIQSSNVLYSLLLIYLIKKKTSKGKSNRTKLTIKKELQVLENIFCTTCTCTLKIQNAGNYLPELCLVDQYLCDSYAIDLTFVFYMT